MALRAKAFDIDEVFSRAVQCRNEFIYDPCRSGGYKDRFAQKYNKERMMPIKWRSLAETLNPQPVAFDVISKLLKWIDRCDEASQRNSRPPPLCAEDGSGIFPEEGSEDELWFLTDVKRKQEADKPKGDEDGPPSSDSDAQDDEGAQGRKAAELTEDSDPDSPRSEPEPQSQGVILPVRHDSQNTRTPDMMWAAGAGASANSMG